MKKKNLFFYVFIILWGLNMKLSAQNAAIELDTNVILIGDQINIKLRVDVPSHAKVAFPNYQDTLSKNIEIIKISDLDSLFEGNNLQLTQTFTITSFDSGFHVIKPFLLSYFIEGDTTLYTVETEPLLLEVKSVPIDENEDIKGLKDIFNVPLTFKEILPYLLSVLLWVIIVLAIVFYFRKRQGKKLFDIIKTPPVPAHIEALKALEQLKEKKLWQHNFIKEYYSELTDIIRIYIEKAMDINAMEMTSDEIICALKKRETKESMNSLEKMFELSDLAKFAKFTPLSSEHDYCFNVALDFVKSTSISSVKEEEEKKEEKVIDENNLESENINEKI